VTVVQHPATQDAEVRLPGDGAGSDLAPGAPVAPARQQRWRTVLFVAAGALALVAAIYAAWEYWTEWQYEVSTDDAYVQADVVAISPQVAGHIATVLVNDNQAVKAGDVLATIDPRDFQTAVAQATADVAAAEASVASINAQLTEQQALINEAQATVNADQATETFAKQNDTRFNTLAKTGYGTVQDAQQATSQSNAATAVVVKDQAALDAARKQVDTLNAQLTQAKATVEHNRAVLDQAQLNLGYTILRAPVDGVVGARALREGLYVQPGQQLLAVVPLDNTYIVANYKETQLAGVTVGQPVSIVVDTYSGTSVRGRVDSVAPASGQEFALLPPDNATGNFTKIVQRVPVKITIDRTDPLAGRLLPGMSVTTTIDVRPGAAGGPALTTPR
jgi:membrane fusion protein (multidrug efflux system)